MTPLANPAELFIDDETEGAILPMSAIPQLVSLIAYFISTIG
jgi:hypothetical protein